MQVFFFLTVPRLCSFCEYFLLSLFRVCLCHTFVYVPSALMSSAGKSLTSWLSCVLCFNVFLSLSHMASLVRSGT